MKPAPITFFKQEISFRLNKKDQLTKWITSAAKKENFTITELNYIFCSDPFLKKMNVKFLKHNYFTDIITFDNSIEKGKIIGDIFISIDTVRINAKQYETTFDDSWLVASHRLFWQIADEAKGDAEDGGLLVEEIEVILLEMIPNDHSNHDPYEKLI